MYVNKSIVITFGLVASVLVAQDEIKIGTAADYPPWAFKKDNVLAGYDVDIVNHICESQNLNCDVSIHPWKTLIKSVRFKKFDVMFDGIAKTEAREKEIAFSRTYGLSQATILTKESGKLSKLCSSGCVKVVTVNNKKSSEQEKTIIAINDAFKGLVLGTQVESVNFYYMSDLFPEMKIQPFDTMDKALEAMLDGTVDAITANSLQIQSLAKLADNSVVLPVKFEGGRLGSGAGFGFRKDETVLIEAFNRGIDGMIESGKLKELSLKWFGTDISPQK